VDMEILLKARIIAGAAQLNATCEAEATVTSARPVGPLQA
jgi:hypothetical protein